jgi:Uma2 family endonuclease
MAGAQNRIRISEAEYLRIERQAEIKSEFFDGEIFAMAGGTATHSLISTNLTTELGNQLKGTGSLIFNADLRVKAEATGLFTYPIFRLYAAALAFSTSRKIRS